MSKPKDGTQMESSQQQHLNGSAASSMESAARAYPWLKSYPPNVDWFAKFTPAPLPSILDLTVARFGEKPATWFFGKTMSYAELANAVNRAAKGLQGLGVGRGSRVGLLFPNCPAFIIFYYAILKAGGTVVSFNPLYTVPELNHQAKDAGLDIMITLDLQAIFPKARSLLDAGVLKTIVVVPFRGLLPGMKGLLFSLFKRKETASWKAGSGIVPATELQANDGRFDAPEINVDDIAVLQYTGGTTGTP